MGIAKLTVDRISPIPQPGKNVLWLVDEVDLEANHELVVVRRFSPSNRNAGDEVDERFSGLFVVDQDELALLIPVQLLLQLVNDCVVRVFSKLSRFDIAVRSCKKCSGG
jgi:hypothetical protein